MIADRRELYNDQVYRYNTRIGQVPGALLAPLFGWARRDFFAPIRPTPPGRTRTCDPGLMADDVWLVRHGETEWARLGRHTGRTDIPLTDVGRAQALALGRRLAGHPFAVVLTSPLSRAAETTTLAGFGEVATTDPDLQEWDYGELEGRPTARHPGGVPGLEHLARTMARRRDHRRCRRPGPTGSSHGSPAWRATRSSSPMGTSFVSSRLAGSTCRQRRGDCSRSGRPPCRSSATNASTPVIESWNEACHLA